MYNFIILTFYTTYVFLYFLPTKTHVKYIYLFNAKNDIRVESNQFESEINIGLVVYVKLVKFNENKILNRKIK